MAGHRGVQTGRPARRTTVPTGLEAFEVLADAKSVWIKINGPVTSVDLLAGLRFPCVPSLRPLSTPGPCCRQKKKEPRRMYDIYVWWSCMRRRVRRILVKGVL